MDMLNTKKSTGRLVQMPNRDGRKISFTYLDDDGSTFKYKAYNSDGEWFDTKIQHRDYNPCVVCGELPSIRTEGRTLFYPSWETIDIVARCTGCGRKERVTWNGDTVVTYENIEKFLNAIVSKWNLPMPAPERRVIFNALRSSDNILRYRATTKGSHPTQGYVYGELEHEELKPCVKCGGVPRFRAEDSVYIFDVHSSLVITCTNCGDFVSFGEHLEDVGSGNIHKAIEKDLKKVVELWNKRKRKYKCFQHQEKVTICPPELDRRIGTGEYKSSYSGECLEAAGLPARGETICNALEKPVVGDFVACEPVISRTTKYIKQVRSIDENGVVVGTKYKDPGKDFSFMAGRISGVVMEVIDDSGKTVYKREPIKERTDD